MSPLVAATKHPNPLRALLPQSQYLTSTSFSECDVLYVRVCVLDPFAAVKHFGKINGMIQLGVAVPSIAAPILGGAVFDATGTYRLHFAITLPVFTLSLLLLAAGKPAVASQAKASAQKAKP